MEIKDKRFKIIVRPNSKESKAEFDAEKGVYRVHVKAKPEDNKANIEVLKLLSRLLKRKVKIASGFKSKEKIIEILD